MLPVLKHGEVARLDRGARLYIEAVRHDDLWAVTKRNGNILTLASFTAALTTDYHDRTAKEQRGKKSLWKQLEYAFSRPPHEHALSTEQVRTLFGEFLLGKRYTIAISGA